MSVLSTLTIRKMVQGSPLLLICSYLWCGMESKRVKRGKIIEEDCKWEERKGR